MAQVFRICTLTNDLKQYAEMKRSFVDAGFNEERACFEPYDNSQGNAYEPYSLFNELHQKTSQPYLILCHQDIRLDRGDGFEKLIKSLVALEEKDPNWAIVGNAGMTTGFKLVINVADPHASSQWAGALPQQVQWLDENFLVVKATATFHASSELSGFHLYGRDFCLNAIKSGYSCYVIDFVLTHLSGGKLDCNFWECLERFKQKWNPHFTFAFLDPAIFLSRYGVLRRIMKEERIRRLLFSNGFARSLLTSRLEHELRGRFKIQPNKLHESRCV